MGHVHSPHKVADQLFFSLHLNQRLNSLQDKLLDIESESVLSFIACSPVPIQVKCSFLVATLWEICTPPVLTKAYESRYETRLDVAQEKLGVLIVFTIKGQSFTPELMIFIVVRILTT